MRDGYIHAVQVAGAGREAFVAFVNEAAVVAEGLVIVSVVSS